MALVATTIPQGAQAVPLLFTLEGSRNASFTLDSMPAPSSFTSLQTNFTNVSGTFNGVETTASLINFGRSDGIFSAAALNIQAPGLGFTQFVGPVIFGGTTQNPTFAPGTFTLNSLVSGRSVLTISAIAAGAVPEPASWAMLIAGFGLVGASMRRRNSLRLVSN
ncbi:hypothetical protein FHS79_000600 [Polymorphobacter multimanifer]|uniref:Ice-binding protein C-terminal domain-containing protein n=1 Tax=Polymorphobacter multimanifer TaxID=1070431 RepID=A0A841L2A6_9SPHN|nr:PEPxxWA-CTERM sorting domain-containing protein [Polymorphobacter multimanifer]MBB6226446.1 hypothetical protein [Polymorphobacter multimanifer]